MRWTMIAIWLAACGGGGGTAADGGGTDATLATDGAQGVDGAASVDAAPAADAAAPDGATGAFVLSSTALPPGGAFGSTYTCATAAKGGQSPPLAWTPGPSGTLSYAIVFTDMSNTLIHWTIWDIPATTTSLPMAVPNVDLPPPTGAKQNTSYDGQTFGYLGPCPGMTAHTYQFVVYAVNTTTLPGVTTASTRPAVKAAITPHMLASASLTGHAATP